MAKAGRLVKELMVRELATALSRRPDFFVASVGPLQATEVDTLRRRLQGVQARVLMIKRTLSLRGLAGVTLDPALKGGDLCVGSVLFVLPGEEALPAAKLLVGFAKDRQEKLVLRGGMVDGQLLDAERLREVAELPSKPQLIAQLIGAIESPVVDVIWTLERVMGDVAWVLEEASKSVKHVGESGTAA